MPATDKTLRINAHETRGITYLSHGQRYEGWVPAGLYEVIGRVEIFAGRDARATVPAIKVYHATHGTWYVGTHVV